MIDYRQELRRHIAHTSIIILRLKRAQGKQIVYFLLLGQQY